MEKKFNVTCRMDRDDVEFLDSLGVQMDRDRSYMINYAVARLKDEHRWQISEVNKALQEVDEGKVLSDEEFEADVKSWR